MLAVTQNERFRILLQRWPAKAVQYIYESYYHNLLLISQSLTNDLNVAEDIVQEVYAEIWNEHEALSKQTNQCIEYFLLRRIKEKSILAHKQKLKLDARRLLKAREAQKFPTDGDIAGFKESPCFQMIYDKFSSREKQCFAMRYFQGLHPEDVAISLKLSRATVDRRLRRARRKLRRYQWALTDPT